MLTTAVLVLSGCLGGDNVDAPTATLTADSTEGDAPLNVTFTMAGTGLGGAGWTLELGNASTETGDSLPAEYTHTFTEPGNHTVTLTVGEGEAAVSDSLVIVVTGEWGALQEYTGSWMVSSPVYCAIVGPVNPGLTGTTTDNTNVDRDTIGRSFSATFTSPVEASALFFRVAFVNQDDGFEIVESFDGAPGAPITGTVPEGSQSVHFSACGITGPVDVHYVAG